MDHYQQFVILPDPEFTETVLLNALMAKLHRALHDYGKGDIGISFPKAGNTLGNVLRLHGAQAALNELHGQVWFKGMRDHCEISDIKPVPVVTKWGLVKRRQPNLTNAKMRRLVQRNSITEEHAELLMADKTKRKLQLPFIQLKSISTGELFRLHIEQQLVDSPENGSFNRYGLSQQATVPWF